MPIVKKAKGEKDECEKNASPNRSGSLSHKLAPQLSEERATK